MATPDDAEDLTDDESDEDELDADDDGRERIPLETFRGFQPGAVAVAPDGGPVPGIIGPPVSIPDATPALFVCLRGPCRYYWELATLLVSGNPAETWGEGGLKDESGKPIRPPRQITRSCTYQDGIDTQFTDDIVYACNRWDPILPADEKRLEKRRRVYLKMFPQYAHKE